MRSTIYIRFHVLGWLQRTRRLGCACSASSTRDTCSSEIFLSFQLNLTRPRLRDWYLVSFKEELPIVVAYYDGTNKNGGALILQPDGSVIFKEPLCKFTLTGAIPKWRARSTYTPDFFFSRDVVPRIGGPDFAGAPQFSLVLPHVQVVGCGSDALVKWISAKELAVVNFHESGIVARLIPTPEHGVAKIHTSEFDLFAALTANEAEDWLVHVWDVAGAADSRSLILKEVKPSITAELPKTFHSILATSSATVVRPDVVFVRQKFHSGRQQMYLLYGSFKPAEKDSTVSGCVCS